MTDRIDAIFLNRNLGTASGWDGDPGEYLMFYDFIPRSGVCLDQGLLQINLGTGKIYITDDADNDGPKFDLVDFLYHMPRP